MSTQKSNLSHALSPRYAESAKKASPFAIAPATLGLAASIAASSSSGTSGASSKFMLSQSAPVASAFMHGGFPAPPVVRPLVAPAAPPPALEMPKSFTESDADVDVWQVGDKLGRSFYSSSMPANLSMRGGMFGGRAERDATADAAGVGSTTQAAGTRRRASSSASALSTSANATIFGFMSGGSATEPSVLEAAAHSGALGSLSSSLPNRFGRFRESIAEETAVGFDDSDDDAVVAARRKAGVRATGRNASDARVDSVTDDLQFSLALDEDL